MIPIVSGVLDLATGYLKNRQKIKAAEAESKARVIEKSADNVADWERQQAINANNSWKDEYLLVVFTIPVIMGFIPSLAPYVLEGFKVLDNMPEWYRYFLGVAVAASFGVRKAARVIISRR